MRRTRQSSLPLTLRWRAEGSERVFVGRGGKGSRQREGCGLGSPETDRGWCAGARGVQKSGCGGARAAGEQLESEEKAQALSSQLCGRS